MPGSPVVPADEDSSRKARRSRKCLPDLVILDDVAAQSSNRTVAVPSTSSVHTRAMVPGRAELAALARRLGKPSVSGEP